MGGLSARVARLERDRPEPDKRLIVVIEDAAGNVTDGDRARLDGARERDTVIIIKKRAASEKVQE